MLRQTKSFSVACDTSHQLNGVRDI